PESALTEAVRRQRLESIRQDAWGRLIKLVKLDKKRDHGTGWNQLDYCDLVSAGPDGQFGTADAVKLPPGTRWHLVQVWWIADESRQAAQAQLAWRRGLRRREDLRLAEGMPGGAGLQFGVPMNALGGVPMPVERAAKEDKKAEAGPVSGGG